MFFAAPESAAGKASLRWTMFVATLACSSLLVVDAGPAAAQMRTEVVPAQTQEEPVKEPVPTERPDSVSAQITARSVGVPIEDVSQRTEMTRTLANPDGTWTLESFPNAIHVEAADGKFVEINTDLREYEGAVSPVASSADLTLSPGEAAGSDGVADLITIAGEDSNGKDASLTLGWEGALPVPALEAADAVYAGAADAVISGGELPADPAGLAPVAGPTVVPSTGPAVGAAGGADVVVETTKSGFSHNVVLNEVPAVPVELRFPLNLSEGLTAKIAASGVIEVRDAAGELVFFGSKPLMWDSVVDERSGLNTKTVDVAAELETTPEGVVLVLRPDQEFLTDPARVYPVTVDPTWSTAVTTDTWVQSDVTSAQHGSTELRAGTWDSGAHKARSYLQFPTSSLNGKKILSASLQVYNWWSYSCTGANILAQRITGSWASNSLVWSNQPAVTTAGQGGLITARGYSSSCPAGQSYLPMTPIVQAWADNPSSNYGVRLIAENETNSNSWRRYHSANYAGSADSAMEPHLQVTYNSYPNTAASGRIGDGQFTVWTDPVTGAKTTYVKTTKPTLSALVSDPDGGTVKGLFSVFTSTSVWAKAPGTTVSSGGRSVMTPTSTMPALVDGTTYTTHMWAHDGSLMSKNYYQPFTFAVDVSAPGAPSVTASGVTNGGWVDTKPDKNTFTFSSTATDLKKFQYSQDGGPFIDRPADLTTKTASLEWTPDGAHELRVRSVDKAENVSAITTFTFGFGGAALTVPKSGATSTDTFRIVASAPPAGSGTVTPKVYWRAAGTQNNMTTFSATNGSSTDWVLADPPATLIAGTESVAVDYKLDGAVVAAAMGKKRVPALFDVQVCFTYTSPEVTRCTWTQETGKVSVLRLPHAFGNGYPVTEAGPGQAALYTGELNLSDTDVSVDAGGTGLSIGRSYSSLSGAGSSAGAFGPGWRASFHGPDAGLAGFLVADTTGIDGTISLIDEDETAMVFRQPDGTKTAGKVGLYTPVDDEAVASGLKVELTGTGTDARITVTEDDGTKTIYLKGKVDDGAQLWDPEKVIGPASVGTVSFTRDADGRITRILAPTQDDTISCTDPAGMIAGCRALDIAYATTTADGKVAGQVDTISFTAYDQVAGAMKSEVVSVYAYDTSNRLSTVTNPRNNQTTTYEYGANTSAGVPSLTSIKDTGLAGYTFTYGAGAGSSRTDWIETVHRDAADGAVNADGTVKTVQVARFVYGVMPDGDGINLPDLRPTAVQLWDQVRTPVRGAAIFAADKPVTSSNATDSTSAASITAGDFRYASLQYWDAEGYTTNTANYGAGAWQNSATDYDSSGNVVRSFTPGAIAQIRKLASEGSTAVTNGVLGNNNEFATITRYTTNEAGTYPTDVWAPVAPSGPDAEPKRSHTRTIYTPVTDQHPVTDKPRMLALETITSEAAPSEGTTDPAAATATGELVLSHIRNGYDAAGSTDKTDLTSGWVHGVPTSVTTVMGTGQTDIISRTVLDARGRVVETRQPGSTGTDAGTTRTYYYTATAQPTAPQCENRPEWVGLICATVPAGAGAVTETTTGYNQFLQPTQTTETGEGGATRTTDTTYLPDGRVDTEKTTVTGLTNSKAVPTTKNLYDPVTGIKTGTATLNDNGGEIAKAVSEIDQWGRTTSYTNAGGETTTTTYTATGQIASTATTHGSTTYTTTYTYDGTDANGKEERRGLPVAMTVNEHGATGTGTYKAAYDAAGALTDQFMPGGITQTRSYDRAGRPEGLAYNGQVTTTAADGTTSTAAGPWIAWTQVRDASGLVTNEATPDGALLTGGTTGDPAAAYHRNYGYDRAGRLTTVQDRTAAPGAVLNTDPLEGPVTGCTTRTYTFDANGNRTTLASAAPGSDGNCSTTTPSTRAWAYDAADRILTGANNTGAYVYDGLGRQTTIPAADAPATDTHAAGAGDITVAYYDTEQAHTITRNGATTEFLLDPEGRRLNAITDGVQETNGYSDSSDNPGWVTASTGSGPIRTRYESVIGGDLGITITGTTAKLALNNPHGDTVATIELPATGNAAGIESWANYDEYGNKTGTTPNTGATTYGWHGAAQRALDNSGLILMGARLYNTITGLFTSRDPVTGGNSTSYVYPQDPINKNDTTGAWWSWSWRGTAQVFSQVSWYAGLVPGWLCAVCGAVAFGAGMVSAGAYVVAGRRGDALRQVGSTAAGVAFGGIGRVGFRASTRSWKATRRYNRVSSRVWNLDRAVSSGARTVGRRATVYRTALHYKGSVVSSAVGQERSWKKPSRKRRYY